MSSEAIPEYCYLLVSVAGAPPGRIVIRLHHEKVPKTCLNFARLCQQHYGERTSRARPLPTYRGTFFHRIVPNFMVQGGDFTNFDGTGGYSVLEPNQRSTFPDESFDVPHDRPGVVSMANRGPNTQGSQFFITLQATSHLDNKHVAFGQVIEGMNVVQSMATDVELEGERPALMQKIVVVDCGVGRGANYEDDDTTECKESTRRRTGTGSDPKRRKSANEGDFRRLTRRAMTSHRENESGARRNIENGKTKRGIVIPSLG
jgi:peptidylprolyl isomerase